MTWFREGWCARYSSKSALALICFDACNPIPCQASASLIYGFARNERRFLPAGESPCFPLEGDIVVIRQEWVVSRLKIHFDSDD